MPQIQTGDPTGTGAGGESYWGAAFRDEHDLKGAAKHDRRGIISMANKGPNTNGWVFQLILFNPVFTHCFRSQWFVTFKPAANLDKKHTVFGSLVGGEDVLDTLEKIPVKPGTERPAQPVRITDIIMFVSPLFFLSLYLIRLSSVTRIPSRNTKHGRQNDEHGKLKPRKKPVLVLKSRRKKTPTV